MAKDKNRGDAARAGNPKERDTSIDATSGAESDSELDIHALLRKYMPDYDADDLDSNDNADDKIDNSAVDKADSGDKAGTDTSGSILKRLRSTEEENADNADNGADGLPDLDAAFTAAPAKADGTDKKAAKQSPDAAEYEFTNNITSVSTEDGYALEDEEGIYDEDDAPRKKKKEPKKTTQKKEKHGLFARRQKRRDTEKEDHVLPPEEFFSDAATDSYAAATQVSMNFDTAPVTDPDHAENDGAKRDELGRAVMDSMDIPQPQTAERLTMPVTQTVRGSEKAATNPAEGTDMPSKDTAPTADNADSFDKIDLDAIAASLTLAEEKADDASEKTDKKADTATDFHTNPDAASSESFDPTDINLMVAFGMDEEEKDKKNSGRGKGKKNKAEQTETREQRAARQVGDRLEAEQSGARKVKLDYPEYMDRSQTPEIQKRYKYKLTTLWIKFGLCGVFTILLMIFENMEVLGRLFTGTAKQFGGVFDPAVYPTVYAMVSLQLMLLACVFAWEQIYDGLRSIFRGTPKPESLTTLLAFAGILYTVMIARITVQSEEPVMFNFIAAFAAWMTLGGAIYNTRREILGFQVVSSPKPKYIVCRVPDDESRCETGAFAEDENICDVMRIEKTDFVDGFFTRLNTPDGTTNLFLSCVMGIIVALSVLFGVFTGVRGGTGIEIARVVIVSLVTMAPLPVFLAFSYPLWRASVAARDFDSAIIGESSLAEYANASIVTFDDKNVFPSYSVKVQNIRIYNNARIDRVMYYAASVFAKAGGPLQDVFEVATIEMGHSDNVNIFDTDRGFLAAEVDGVNILFGSAKALAERGLKIPREVFDEDADMSDELSIMYMFREDRLVAKMYIQYVMDGDIELILGQFQNSGLYVCVRTFDPNIDERMIAHKVNMKRIPLKVVRYASAESETAEKASSGLVTCGSPKSLLQVISYCDKVLHTKKTNIALCVLAMLIGAAVMVLLVLSGSIGVMTSLYIAVYQMLWLIPMLLSSKMFIR